jgi:hypothetical protein
MADQCATLDERPLRCYAALFENHFQLVHHSGVPFVFLEGLQPKEWKPDGHVYALTVRETLVRFGLVSINERLRMLPFVVESPSMFYMFRSNGQYPQLLTAINALYREHGYQGDRYVVPSVETLIKTAS